MQILMTAFNKEAATELDAKLSGPRVERPWSLEQLAIYQWLATYVTIAIRNLVVRARAGTGKSTTMTEAVKRCLETHGGNAEAKTFHSLGYMFVRRNAKCGIDNAGKRKRDLALAVAGNAPEPVIRKIAELHSKGREIEPFAKCGADLLPLAVKFDLLPEAEHVRMGWTDDDVCNAAYDAMVLARSKRAPQIDFADMIYLPLVLGWVKPMYDMVVIDEAQDCTVAQLALARGACRADGNVIVVGDDRQAIYGFRGADSDSLDRLKSELEADELTLATTYRCGKVIVELAKTIVPDYVAGANNPEGTIASCNAEQLIDLADGNDFVLSRTNAPLGKVCMALLKAGKRARIRGRDIQEGIRRLVKRLDVRDIKDLARAMAEWQTEELDRAAHLPAAVADTKMAMVADQHDLIMALSEGCKSMADLDRQFTELFTTDPERGSITCMTTHKAKGLETDRVFMLAGTFRESNVEELNIKYVCITRAKSTLTMVSGFERKIVS